MTQQLLLFLEENGLLINKAKSYPRKNVMTKLSIN